MRGIVGGVVQGMLLVSIGVVSVAAFVQEGMSGEVGDEPHLYTVTVTNETRGQLFAPPLVFSHKKKVAFFEIGEPASSELAAIAEGGNTSLLSEILVRDPNVLDVAKFENPPMQPGETRTLTIMAGGGFKRLSVVAMLNPTNDGFFAVQGVKIPSKDTPLVIHATAYDAGSEPNDELCVNIAGPICAEVNGGVIGQGQSPDEGGEGYIHVHNGIYGVGDLSPQMFNWNNPVAKITIRQLPEE